MTMTGTSDTEGYILPIHRKNQYPAYISTYLKKCNLLKQHSFPLRVALLNLLQYSRPEPLLHFDSCRLRAFIFLSHERLTQLGYHKSTIPLPFDTHSDTDLLADNVYERLGEDPRVPSRGAFNRLRIVVEMSSLKQGLVQPRGMWQIDGMRCSWVWRWIG